MSDETYVQPGKLKVKCLRMMRVGLLDANEVALRSKVSRATVYNWAKAAGIDLAQARHNAANRIWRNGR